VRARLVVVALVVRRLVVEANPVRVRLVPVAAMKVRLEVEALAAKRLVTVRPVPVALANVVCPTTLSVEKRLVAPVTPNDDDALRAPVNVAVLPKMLPTVRPVVEALVEDAKDAIRLVVVAFTKSALVDDANAAKSDPRVIPPVDDALEKYSCPPTVNAPVVEAAVMLVVAKVVKPVAVRLVVEALVVEAVVAKSVFTVRPVPVALMNVV
jgi:hypothetical protein